MGVGTAIKQRRSRRRGGARRCSSALVALVLVAGLLGACRPFVPVSCAGFSPRPLPEFVFGSAATDVDTTSMTRAAEIGYRWVRIPIRWNMLEPTVAEIPRLTRADVDADPHLVDEFAKHADWSVPDATLVHAASLGLKVIGFVGASSPPTSLGSPLDPGRLGTETYLAMQDLSVRAIVRRYGRALAGAPAGLAPVQVWQTENELNISAAQTLIGWRTPAGLDSFFRSPWASFDFQTSLLETLRGAVVWGDPDAVTEVNLNLDMHDNFNRPFGRPGWREVVGQWRTLADVIGLDTYPNYYAAEPVDGRQVGRAAAAIASLGCPGQQVMVVETDYPNGPAARGYSPARQAAFLEQAWTSARDAGVAGFMPFAITDGHAADPVYTAADHADLDRLGYALRSGDIGALASLYVLRFAWMNERMPELTQAVEGRWGVYGPAGEALPALDVVQAIARETAGG